MSNLGQMLKQAQEMQSKMAEMQAKLEGVEVTGASGGGLVTVTLGGKGDVRKIKIDPSIVDAEDVEVLEDLITAGVNDAKGKQEQAMREKMSDLTGGPPLPPGMQLPF